MAASLTVDFILNSAKAVSGMNNVGDAATRQQGKFRKLGGVIAGALSVGAVVAFGKEAVEAAAADEQAQALLAKTLKDTTGATDAQVAAGEEYISNLSKQTALTDDELRPALATLAQATGDQEQAQRDLALATDIAAATGKPLATVTDAMAKAALGNTTAFARLTKQAANVNGEAQTMDELMANAADTMGGQAAVAAETTAGKMAGAQIAMGEMSETVGSALLPMLGALSGFLSENIAWLGPLVGIIVAVVAAIWLWNAAQLVLASTLWTSLAPFLPIILAVAALIAIGILVWKNWDKIVAFLKKAWEALKRAATAIFSAIGEFIGRIWDSIKATAQRVWNGIKTTISDVWDGIKNAVATAVNWVKDKLSGGFRGIATVIKAIWNGVKSFFTAYWETIVGIFQGAWDFFQSFVDFLGTVGDAIAETWESVTAVISGVWTSVVDAIKTGINWIIDRVNTVIGGINTAINLVNKLPGPNIPNIPTIPRLAAGGIITRPTLALIGERGPEAVVPSGAGMGGNSYTLNVNTRRADAADVAWGFRRLELLRTGR